MISWSIIRCTALSCTGWRKCGILTRVARDPNRARKIVRSRGQDTDHLACIRRDELPRWFFSNEAVNQLERNGDSPANRCQDDKSHREDDAGGNRRFFDALHGSIACVTPRSLVRGLDPREIGLGHVTRLDRFERGFFMFAHASIPSKRFGI